VSSSNTLNTSHSPFFLKVAVKIVDKIYAPAVEREVRKRGYLGVKVFEK
jgi:hypothetical protein